MRVRTRLGEEFETDILYPHQDPDLGMDGDLYSDHRAARNSHTIRRDAAVYDGLIVITPRPVQGHLYLQKLL